MTIKLILQDTNFGIKSAYLIEKQPPNRVLI